MNKPKIKGFSQYIDKLHKIVICGQCEKEDIELYDINKDKWMTIPIPASGVMISYYDLWVSKDNPNIVNIIKQKGFKAIDSRLEPNHFYYYTKAINWEPPNMNSSISNEICQIDLRSNNCFVVFETRGSKFLHL